MNTSTLLLVTVVATWIMSKIERCPNSSYGLGGNRKLSHLLAGLGWGVICLSLLVAGLWTAGYLVIDKRLLFGFDTLRYGAIWFVGFLVVGLVEEYLARGYLLFTLSRGLTGIYHSLVRGLPNKALGFWTAALILSILFGLGHDHNPDESPIGLLSAGLASLVFCLSQLVAHRLAVVGYWVPCCLGLGSIVLVWCGGQRRYGAESSAGNASGWKAGAQRRSYGSRGQPVRAGRHGGHHGYHLVHVIGRAGCWARARP